MHRTIPNLFRRTVDAVPDKVWLVAGDDELTYAGALHRIEQAASALRVEGIGRGDRVLTTPRNTTDHLLSWFALMEVGAIQVPINPKSTVDELAGFVAQVDPALVVTDATLEATVDRAIGAAAADVRRVDVADLFRATPDGRGPATIDPADIAVMIPTSGTTGRSKLVMQTHLAYVMAGEGFPYWMQLTADDRLLTTLPLFHINAPAYSTLGSVAAQAGLVLLPGFSASELIDEARRHEATELNSIGAMLEILMRQPPRADDADNPLRRCYTGPSPTRERQEEIEKRFGFEIVCGYALSESPYALIWRHGTRPFGTLGSTRQHPELGHVNDARVIDGDDLAVPGSIGELELRNPVITPGYYEMPAETAAVMHDGWLRTGDLVTGNADGTYTFIGRKKEVIRRRGENLSPAEVEAVLEQHPAVIEAAVVGVPSELSEEDVKAFVIVADGPDVPPLDLAEVHAFARARLAAYKVPRYLEVVRELPHTATDRLAKHRLPLERTADEVDFQPARGEASQRGDR